MTDALTSRAMAYRRKTRERRAGNPDAPPHRCPVYLDPRGELIDPRDQSGIGCPICWPPDGRYRKPEAHH